jgi:actin-related protein
MKRNLFTKDEITLCTYIARFGKREFDENDIQKLKERSISSIKMKVQNIASMLDENGFETDDNVSKLTGKPPGEKGRKTNWDIVSKLADLKKQDLLSLCQKIIEIRL